MECYASPCEKNPRKRPRIMENWKRARLKRQRYGPIGPPTRLSCNHNKKGKSYRCNEISEIDQKCFHAQFYDQSCKSNELKLRQDSFILKFTESTIPKRSRTVNNTRGENSIVTKYFIYKKSSHSKIPVCQQAFVQTLRLSKNRVKGVVGRHFMLGGMPKDKRGGDRKLKDFEEKRQSVMNFIKKFKVLESHYCRAKTSFRQYLPSDLSIKKMWRLYDSETSNNSKKVKESYFRYVFRTNFNLGFGSPRTDECSKCLSLQEKIKNCKDQQEKQNLMCEQRCHKLKAKAFYSLLKEKRDDLITISFDFQKNQVLPKLPDQSAYYARQIFKYNLTIVVGDSKCKQTNNNVFIYHYDESDHKKSSNEVSSAVYHCLQNLQIPDTVNVLRIMSDGCGGQNKNTTVMGMLSYWLFHNAPTSIKLIEFDFPVVGHSYLPSDRVFARIEKTIKKNSIIVNPEEYTQIFSQFGSVVSLANKVFDWKERCSEIYQPPGKWHVKFNPCKRFFLKRNKKGDNVILRGEVHYRTELGNYKSVCRKTKKVSTMPKPKPVPAGIDIAPLKLRDVSALLTKHFGDNWKELETLNFYKNIPQIQQRVDDVQQEGEEEEERDCFHNAVEVDDLVV